MFGKAGLQFSGVIENVPEGREGYQN